MASPTKDELARDVMEKLQRLEVQLAETKTELSSLKATVDEHKPVIEQAKEVRHSARTVKSIAQLALPLLFGGLVVTVGYAIYKSGINEQRLTQSEKGIEDTKKALEETKTRLEETRNGIYRRMETARGEIAAISEQTIALKQFPSGQIEYALAPDVEVRVHDKRATIADLRIGMMVELMLATNINKAVIVTGINEIGPIKRGLFAFSGGQV